MSKFKLAIVRIMPVMDILYLPVAAAVGLLAKPFALMSRHMTRSRGVIDRFGLSIIRHHYYGPVVLPTDIRRSLREDRGLDFIDFRAEQQLELLSNMDFVEEIKDIADREINGLRFNLANNNFGPGDFEIYYSMIRHIKPQRIVEIGAGHSTVIAALAAQFNRRDGIETEIISIEPFEQPWLEQLGVKVLRQKVEEVGMEIFDALTENDILFIDSSHVIRPQGDVLFEFFSLLPRLHPGVIVHLHDIFTPHDYPDEWVLTRRRLWNEQYLLEAFLAYNETWKSVV